MMTERREQYPAFPSVDWQAPGCQRGHYWRREDQGTEGGEEDMSDAPAIGTELRSMDPRDGGRRVRVIEHELGITGQVRRLRVENTRTERRTFLRWPLASEWIYALGPEKAGKGR